MNLVSKTVCHLTLPHLFGNKFHTFKYVFCGKALPFVWSESTADFTVWHLVLWENLLLDYFTVSPLLSFPPQTKHVAFSHSDGTQPVDNLSCPFLNLFGAQDFLFCNGANRPVCSYPGLCIMLSTSSLLRGSRIKLSYQKTQQGSYCKPGILWKTNRDQGSFCFAFNEKPKKPVFLEGSNSLTIHVPEFLYSAKIIIVLEKWLFG